MPRDFAVVVGAFLTAAARAQQRITLGSPASMPMVERAKASLGLRNTFTTAHYSTPLSRVYRTVPWPAEHRAMQAAAELTPINLRMMRTAVVVVAAMAVQV